MGSAIAFEGRGTSGLPLLFVHGFPLDRTMWQGQLDGLATLSRTVALDLPGFGATPAASNGQSPTTMEELSEHVLAVADGLGFAQFILCGHSMGGYVAMSFARRHPERLCGLVLCDTRAEPDNAEARRGRAADADRVLTQGVGPLVEKQIRSLLSPETLANKRDLAVAVETMIRRSSPQGVAAALRGMAARADMRSELRNINVPTLAVVGSDDVITPPMTMQAMASAIRGCELAVIPRAGHLAPFEQPDAVNAAIRKLVRRAVGQGPTPRKQPPPPPRPRSTPEAKPEKFDPEATYPPVPGGRRRGPGVAR